MVSLGEVIAISSSISSTPRFRLQASSQRVHLLPRHQLYSAASTDCKSLCFLRTRSDPGVHQKGFLKLTRATVTPDSIARANFSADLTVEPVEVVPDSTTGGGDNLGGAGEGGGGGGGGGNNWGNNNNKGEGGSEESDDKSKKTGMSMSQKLTLGYAALVGIGGVMGYVKTGSQKSLMAGGLSALLLYYVYTQLPTKPVFASALGLGLSAALLAVMGSRFKRSGKVFPAGVVSLVSLVMSGGYLHGIMRSFH
ncbi:hypothetical protein LguiA_004116 [Lonicera macranthoides]